MNKDKKVKLRFFTIADWEEEELFLTEQHKQGWKFKKLVFPSFYIFEKCEPKDVVYKLDFGNHNCADKDNYIQMFRDEGWEYLCEKNEFSYFRKSNTEQENADIFSDVESKLEMAERIQKRKVLPLVAIFLCCVIPQFSRAVSGDEVYGELADVFTVFWVVMMVVYIWLLMHSTVKFKKIKEKYQR